MSSGAPWVRRARSTTPCSNRPSSGVSKKYTSRIRPCSRSTLSPVSATRCSGGTVIFSSTLPTSDISRNIATISSRSIVPGCAACSVTAIAMTVLPGAGYGHTRAG